jgi:methionyl-tRNA synthetase
MKKNFYVTTPIYYVNDRPHIGHAYTSVACDVLARFMRLDGCDVKFLTGTDEHGQKVEKSAAQAGVAPKAFVNQVSQHFRDLTKTMNISNDDFIRTTDERHIKSAQAIWKKMQANGHIYLGSYAGWYAVRDEAFYQESELVGGKAPTGAEVEWVEEPSYFFKLSAFGDKLLKHYDEHPDFIGPETRRNEVRSFVKGGLKDLSVSRTTFKWGIPVPGDEKHIMYVWLDALTNYLSAVGYPDTNAEEYKKFWPANLHMVGKDIVRFHAVYWPAFLMAADLPLPKRVFAHGWWTIEGEKMSKSLGNVIAPQDLVNEFGLDQTRWFLMREVPFGNDGNFSRERMVNVINSELANNIGNLVQRTLSMINKNCDGKVPNNKNLTTEDEWVLTYREIFTKYKFTPQDGAIKAVGPNFPKSLGTIGFYNLRDAIAQQNFSNYFDQIMEIANSGNAYIDTKAPWKLKKENNINAMHAVLYVSSELIRVLAILLQAIMPNSASKILEQLAVPSNERTFKHLNAKYALKPGTPLPAPEPVFPRIVENVA